ncbi:MAG TPA: GNAT family N-acetyltransferase [Candidatus Limnocylindrales bacterium]
MYHTRPATTADLPAIHQLIAACETRLHGRPQTDPDAVAAHLARPGLDPTTDTRVVHDEDGTLVAHAWVDRRCEIHVHPEHHGQRLGTQLLHWAETRARQTGIPRITQTIPDTDTGATKLLAAHGYQPLVTSWLLETTTREPVTPPPPGITIRAFQAADAPEAHLVTEDAFDEWQQRRKDFPEWARNTVRRTTFAPAMSPVAHTRGGQLIGVLIALDDPRNPYGYIESLAVHRDHRNHGIARHLLRYAFDAFARNGKPTTTLWTHSETGALTLYQRVGMTVRRSSTVHAKELFVGETGAKRQAS